MPAYRGPAARCAIEEWRISTVGACRLAEVQAGEGIVVLRLVTLTPQADSFGALNGAILLLVLVTL